MNDLHPRGIAVARGLGAHCTGSAVRKRDSGVGRRVATLNGTVLPPLVSPPPLP